MVLLPFVYRMLNEGKVRLKPVSGIKSQEILLQHLIDTNTLPRINTVIQMIHAVLVLGLSFFHSPFRPPCPACKGLLAFPLKGNLADSGEQHGQRPLPLNVHLLWGKHGFSSVSFLGGSIGPKHSIKLPYLPTLRWLKRVRYMCHTWSVWVSNHLFQHR